MNAKMVKAIRPLFDLRSRRAKKKFWRAKKKANRATTPRSIKALLYGDPRMAPGQPGMYRRLRARRRTLLKITKRSRRTNR